MRLCLRTTLLAAACLSALLPASFAQAPAAALASQANRIADAGDLSARTRMSAQLPAWVNPARDAGPAPDEAEVGLTFILTRTPELQAAFEKLLADQQNPASASYHQWLSPQQIGAQFGPTQHDIAAITAWLAGNGLTVKEVTPSRLFIHAYGPASVAGSALGTTFRMFNSLGKTHLSAATEPAIPAAFAGVIGSIAGLTDVELTPQSRISAPVLPTRGTHGDANPNYTSGQYHYVFPGDFATIFDIKPLYNAGINGAGQKVAVIGRTAIYPSDITAFESISALPNNPPNIIVPSTGVTPSVSINDEGESDLDLERVVGTAPNATLDFVTSGTANGYNGIYVAAQYEVQTQLDPILTLSYGGCEANAGASGVSLWSTLFSQAAAEGITVFVSSADSGAATCDTQFAPAPATQIRSINYICSNPYNTCVGGTELVDTTNPTTYWATSNGTGDASALSYIPEGGWNDPTQVSNGVTSYIVQASGGGASTIVAKPTYQTGVGVPADGFRDVPDVSFPASGHDGYFGCEADITSFNGNCATGGGVIFSGTSAAAPSWAGVTALLNQKAGVSQGNLNYSIYRLAANTANGAFHDITPATTGIATCDINTPSLCNNSTPAPTTLQGGLVGYPVTVGYDQVTGWGSVDVAKFVAAAVTPYQGTFTTVTANPTTIVAGATSTFTATVTNTVGGTPTGTVQFYSNGIAAANAIGAPVKLTGGTTAVSAPIGFPTAGTYSITAIYSGDTIFTGSNSAAITLTVTGTSKPATTSVLTLSAVTATTQKAISATATVTSTTAGTLTGSVQFFNNGAAIGNPVTLAAGAATLPAMVFPVGTDSITCVYSGDSNYASSSCPAMTLTVTAVTTSSTLTSTATTGSVLTPISFTDTVISTSGTGTPTGTATLKVDGATRGTAVTLVNGVATFPAATLVSGTHVYTVVYSGDTTFSTSTSNPISITLTALTSASTISLSPSVIVVNGSSTLGFTVAGPTGAPVPTGSVLIYVNGASYATGTLTAGPTSSTVSGSLQFTGTGVSSIYGVYSGDANYAPSTSATASLTVQGFTAAALPASLALSAGAATANTSTITYTSVQGFAGAITSTCTIAFSSGTASLPPTCTVGSAASVAANGTGTTTITIGSVAPHAREGVFAQNRPASTRTFFGGGVAFAAFLFAVSARRRRTLGKWRALGVMLFLVTGLAALSGCGNNFSSPAAPSGGTTPGSYVVTVTGTAGTATATSTVNLTIN